MKTHIKTLAVSLSLLISANAFSGMGGLNVQSHLGEPFSGSIVVTGKEAQAILQSGSVSVSGAGISGSVSPQGNGNAVIRLRSGSSIREPVVSFSVKAGNQTRQYTALLNPARYQAPTTPTPPKPQTTRLLPNTPKYETPPPVVNVVNEPYETPEITEPQNPKIHKNKSVKPKKEHEQLKQKKTPVLPKQRPMYVPHQDNAQYHRVRAGETLAQIADRYRPHHVSQQRAMRMIVAANPRAFNRSAGGDVMYNGVTLYIPTAEQFSGTKPSQPQHNPPTIPKNTTPPAITQPEETPNVAPEPVAPTPPVPTPVEPKTTPDTALQAASEETKKPEPTASAVEASAPTQDITASETISASDAKASDTETTDASAIANASETETNASEISEPVAPTETPTATEIVEPEETESEEVDWLSRGLMGLGGLAVLSGGAYLWSRRRKVDEEDEEITEEQDEDQFLEEVFIDETLTSKTGANVATPTASGSVSTEFDDEFGEVGETHAPTVAPDTPQEEEETWEDWINDNVPLSDPVKPEPPAQTTNWNEMDSDDEWEGIDIAPENPTDNTSEGNDWFAESADDEGLSFDMGKEDFRQPEETAMPAGHYVNDDALPFDIEELSEPTMPNTSFEIDGTDLAEPTSFDLNNITPGETPTDFNLGMLDDTEYTDTELVINPNSSEDINDDAIDFEADFADDIDDVEAEEYIAVEIDNPVSGDDGLEFYNDIELPEDNVAENIVIPPIETTAPDTIGNPLASGLGWESNGDTHQVGFISEVSPVGLEEPQEAKLELARMYVEIDDAVAARATLRELIAESSGELKEQAQRLLQELGD